MINQYLNLVINVWWKIYEFLLDSSITCCFLVRCLLFAQCRLLVQLYRTLDNSLCNASYIDWLPRTVRYSSTKYSFRILSTAFSITVALWTVYYMTLTSALFSGSDVLFIWADAVPFVSKYLLWSCRLFIASWGCLGVYWPVAVPVIVELIQSRSYILICFYALSNSGKDFVPGSRGKGKKIFFCFGTWLEMCALNKLFSAIVSFFV